MSRKGNIVLLNCICYCSIALLLLCAGPAVVDTHHKGSHDHTKKIKWCHGCKKTSDNHKAAIRRAFGDMKQLFVFGGWDFDKGRTHENSREFVERLNNKTLFEADAKQIAPKLWYQMYSKSNHTWVRCIRCAKDFCRDYHVIIYSSSV